MYPCTVAGLRMNARTWSTRPRLCGPSASLHDHFFGGGGGGGPSMIPWLMAIHDYPRLSTTIHDYPWLSTTIHDYPWLSMTIHDYPWLSMTTHDHCNPLLAYPAYFRGDEIWQFSPYCGLNAIKPRFDRYSCGLFMTADFPWCVSLCLRSISSNISLRCRDIPPQSQTRRSCKKSALV